MIPWLQRIGSASILDPRYPEILHPLWNSELHYHDLKNPALNLILSQMNPLHALPPCFC
jgi:hypothetical protein